MATVVIGALPARSVAQGMVDLDRRGVGYPVYRIPALAVSNVGTLVAAYDARPSMADLPSRTAVVVRRSRDGGTTWSDRVVLRGDTATTGFGDPSLLVDRTNGRIFLFYAAAVRQGFFGSATGNGNDDPNVLHADVSWSDDDGQTWQHRRLTSAIKDAAWGGLFASSGAGIQLRHGPHAGRLVQQFAVRVGTGTFAMSVYSDDHGASWHAGALVGPGMDENKTAELADGTLMLSSRAKPYRLVASSTSGGEQWSEVHADSTLIDPANNGALVRYNDAAPVSAPESHWVLFSNTASTMQRVNLTVRLSYDDGRTWPVRKTIVPGAAGYSTLVTMPNGDIALLFERGDYDAITFMRFPRAWLTR